MWERELFSILLVFICYSIKGCIDRSAYSAVELNIYIYIYIYVHLYHVQFRSHCIKE